MFVDRNHFHICACIKYLKHKHRVICIVCACASQMRISWIPQAYHFQRPTSMANNGGAAGTGPTDMNCSMYSRRLNQPGSPESEFNNFECFQNYTAPEVFVQGLAGIVNQGDVEVMIRAQKQMLQRFEKTNEMLLNCNALSASRLKAAGDEFKKHSKQLGEMKKDLDYIFKKIRNIKSKISTQYPDAYAAAQPKSRQSFAEEADDETVGAAAEAAVTAIGSRAESGPSTSVASKNVTKTLEKRKSAGSANKVSIDYVQIAEQSPVDGNGVGQAGDVVEGAVGGLQLVRRALGSSTENSNDSSDGTSDTN